MLLIHGVIELFAPKKLRDVPAVQPPTPKQSPETQPASSWTEEDDLCLIQMILQYSFNWNLVTDAFNAIRLPKTGERRTAWQCHERWKQNNLTSLSGQVSPGKLKNGWLFKLVTKRAMIIAYISKLKREASKRPSIVRFESTKKRQRQYNILDSIQRTQKRRDEIQKPAGMVWRMG